MQTLYGGKTIKPTVYNYFFYLFMSTETNS